MPTKGVSPRISMIVGLATTGEVYCSLTQVNTDENVVMQFVGRLATQLAKEDSEYRKNTVILMDNASYHRTK